jgi:hypothetical protein
MLTHINDRLIEWALWKKGARRVVGGISPFPAYNLAGGGGRRGSGDGPPAVSYVPVNELECADTDRCVCALEPLLRQAIEEIYLRIGTTDQAAAQCKCSRMTLHRRMTEAHNLILGYLNDLSAGVEVRSWQQTEEVIGIKTVPIATGARRKRLTA